MKRNIGNILNFKKKRPACRSDAEYTYEFCPRCEANLILQKGYDNTLPYWICRGCGEMLINPSIDSDSGIVWLCDECQTMLNIQPGFSEDCGLWKCLKCGHGNEINPNDVFASDDEYQNERHNPYRGLSDEELLELSSCEEIGYLKGHENVILVKQRETEEHYIKKIIKTYDASIYRYLMEHPVRHMPRILRLFEGQDVLIVIEELIQGATLERILEDGSLKPSKAARIAIELCEILDDLQHQERPIVHRDIKPSNIIISPKDEAWLLDVNAAKWHNPEEKDDTRSMGTWNYAAPEQAGYGMTASSPKTDIYAVGMLLNVMITRKFPKEKQAKGPIWDVIERCISLNAEERYTAAELAEVLKGFCED